MSGVWSKLSSICRKSVRNIHNSGVCFSTKTSSASSEMVGWVQCHHLWWTSIKCSELHFARTSAMKAPFWEVCTVHCAVLTGWEDGGGGGPTWGYWLWHQIWLAPGSDAPVHCALVHWTSHQICCGESTPSHGLASKSWEAVFQDTRNICSMQYAIWSGNAVSQKKLVWQYYKRLNVAQNLVCTNLDIAQNEYCTNFQLKMISILK